MDVLVFIVCLTFGLVLTLIGLRSSVVAYIALLFNALVFSAVGASGLTEVLPIGAEGYTVSYDAFPAVLLPALFAVLNFFKIIRYR